MEQSQKILVTGASGQLGQALKRVVGAQSLQSFHFVGSAELDIANANAVDAIFREQAYTHCINCAAYTQVDQAEEDKEKAYLVNAQGAKNLAEACSKHQVVLIHISTDFVFDGSQKHPYTENDATSPIGVYGASKREGEVYIETLMERYYILRTSWLYSEFGHNFMKTMLRLGAERDQLSVVDDQWGTPTYAVDLAKTILQLVQEDRGGYGLYHYSNEGKATWCQFAQKIMEFSGLAATVLPIPTEAYPTKAKRPKYSVLNKTKIKTLMQAPIPDWEDGLQRALEALKP